MNKTDLLKLQVFVDDASGSFMNLVEDLDDFVGSEDRGFVDMKDWLEDSVSMHVDNATDDDGSVDTCYVGRCVAHEIQSHLGNGFAIIRENAMRAKNSFDQLRDMISKLMAETHE